MMYAVSEIGILYYQVVEGKEGKGRGREGKGREGKGKGRETNNSVRF